MNKSEIVLVISVGYLAASLIVGMLPGRKASASATGYVAGDRTVGLFVMYFITGASVFSAFAFLGLPGWAYSRGAAAFYILAYGAIGLLPLYFLGPRAARIGRTYGAVTQAELIARRFDLPAIAGVMAVVSVVAFIPYLAIQITGAGIVLEMVTDRAVPREVGGALVYAVVLGYVLRSGVLGVGWTNTFQGMFMMVLAWGLGLYLPHLLHGGVQPMFENLESKMVVPPGLTPEGESWGWGEFSTAILVSSIGLAFWPHLFMKAFTARDDATIRKTVVLYPTFSLFLVPLLLIGFCGIGFEPAAAKPDEILPHMLMNLEIPAVLVGLFCAGALAASMSSGDAMVHAAASIAVRDGYVTALRGELSPDAERRWIRFGVVAVMIASYLVAVLYTGDLVPMLLTSYGAIVQFAPAIFATLYWRRATGLGVFGGMLLGTVVTTVFILAPEVRPWPIHAGVYGLVANLAWLAVTLRRGPVDDSEYLRVARGD